MVILVAPDQTLSDRLYQIIRLSLTPEARSILRVGSLGELPASPLRLPCACVVAAPPSGEDPHAWFAEFQRRAPRAGIILLLPRDDPALALELLHCGAYDLAYARRFSALHLGRSIAHAANRAPVRPYSSVFGDTCEFNPLRGSPWAAVLREEVSAWTDVLDYQALRELRGVFGLEEDGVVFREVVMTALPVLRGLPSLVMAVLSVLPSSEDRRADFLAVIRSLEADERRVLYLARSGVTLSPGLPPELRPRLERMLVYSSAIELLLRLSFGFGAGC